MSLDLVTLQPLVFAMLEPARPLSLRRVFNFFSALNLNIDLIASVGSFTISLLVTRLTSLIVGMRCGR